MKKGFSSVCLPGVLRHLFFSWLCLLALSAAVDARDVPAWQGHVNDYAQMISAEARTRLEDDLRALETSDTTQIYLLTVPSLEGEVLEEFAIRVFDAWKAGQRKLDNGVILIVAQQERKIRIEVGRGLEGRLTDLEAGRIIDTVMKPLFKAGQYEQGLTAGVAALIRITRGEFRAAEQAPSGEGRSSVIFFLLNILMPQAERLLEFIGAAFGLIIVLYLLGYLNWWKGLLASMAAGAVALPVAAFFTVGGPGPLLRLHTLCFLTGYGVLGGLIGAAVHAAHSGEERRRGPGRRDRDSSALGSSSDDSSSSSSSNWSDDSSSSDRSSSSGDSGSSGGEGGSSGGGGASGDY